MNAIDLKPILSAIAILLTFIGYYPYIKSVLQKHTKPHFYSWLVWTIDGCIIFGLQITHGAGAGSFVVFSATILSAIVLFLTLKDKNKLRATTSDKIFLLLAFLSLFLWLIAKQPLLSALLIMSVDVFGFIPTIRKSWIHPHSENSTFYIINTVRFTFAFAALSEYSVITILYPSVWFFGNALFTLMLILRRKSIR